MGNDVIIKNNPVYESTKKAISDNKEMPPIRISIDNRGNIIIKDGNNRLVANRELGNKTIKAVYDRDTLKQIYEKSHSKKLTK